MLCGLPLRRPPNSQLIHARHSGKFFLHVTAHPDFGLPFGQDRLIPIWVATLALQQKNRTIHFASAAQMLDFFHLPKDGPHYRRLVGGFQRIFAATIFFGTDERPNGARLIDFSRFHFFDRMRLWFNADSIRDDTDREFQTRIQLPSARRFTSEIDQHRIPVEREAIACFAHRPYKPVIAPDQGARQSSILWTTTKVFAPVVQRIRTPRYERGDRDSSSRGGTMFGRVRPIGSATSLLSWRYVSSNLTAPSRPGSSNGKMCARLAQHRGSSPRPGTTPGWFNGRTRGC